MSKTIKMTLYMLGTPFILLFVGWIVILVYPNLDSFVAWYMYLGYVITLLGILISYFVSREKSLAWKFIVWGTAISILTAPVIYSTGITFGLYGGPGFVAVGTWIVFSPILFFIGIIVLFVGFLLKKWR